MRRAGFHLLIFLGLAFSAAAEDLPPAPGAQRPILSAAVRHFVQPLVVVPSAPRTAEAKRFWALTAMANALTLADIEMTQNCLATIRNCHEIDPIYGKYPSRARMYAINVPINAAAAYFGYRALNGKRKSRLWMLPQIAVGATHFAGVLTNLSVR